MTAMRATIPAAATILVASMLFAPRASAQNTAAADVLFQKGKEAFDAKRYADACPAFAESYRLDPVSGSLVALAACYEADGKLASAWSRYGELAALADREGKKERADAARKRAAELEPKLARLTISVATEARSISGLVVRRDETEVGSASFEQALPIDRGEHIVTATAPARASFTQKIAVVDGAEIRVAVPALSAQAALAPADDKTSSIVKPIGWGAIGVGALAAGIGGYFGIAALSKKSDSDEGGCVDRNLCSPIGAALRNEARNQGNISTALFVVSGVFVATGIVLVIVGSSKAPDKPSVTIVPSVAYDRPTLGLEGRF